MLSNLKLAFVLCSLIVISEFNDLAKVNSQTPGSKGDKGNAIKFLFQQISSHKFLTALNFGRFCMLNGTKICIHPS